MNLYFRLLSVLILSIFKKAIPVNKLDNSLVLSVLPNDIDINLHMNNGRYLTICDLTRVDLFLRSGLAKTMIKQGWMPMISEHTMKYKKGLRLFQQYHCLMTVTGWDEKSFHMQHTFKVAGRIVAEGTSLGVIVSKTGVIPPAKVLEAVQKYRD